MFPLDANDWETEQKTDGKETEKGKKGLLGQSQSQILRSGAKTDSAVET